MVRCTGKERAADADARASHAVGRACPIGNVWTYLPTKLDVPLRSPRGWVWTVPNGGRRTHSQKKQRPARIVGAAFFFWFCCFMPFVGCHRPCQGGRSTCRPAAHTVDDRVKSVRSGPRSEDGTGVLASSAHHKARPVGNGGLVVLTSLLPAGLKTLEFANPRVFGLFCGRCGQGSMAGRQHPRDKAAFLPRGQPPYSRRVGSWDQGIVQR